MKILKMILPFFLFMVSAYFLFHFTSVNTIGIIISLLTLIISIWIFTKITKKERDRIQNELYDGLNFNQIRIKGLSDYLKLKGIEKDKEKIQDLIKLTEEEISEGKLPYIFGNGLMLALLIPVWNQLITWKFTREIVRFNDGLILTLVITILVVLFFFYITFMKNTFHDDIINNKQNKLKTIKNDLKEIHFNL
ncbi:hypothetical protein EHS13_13515 [Paenibacillus psychroresistens]|uniref:Uncharacterized protein n=1 Tax=Paenibacillus psychroresistens TaxID=1778678 RepID=A0A6B8RH63_9BACL|nr:hypothetical protein [Paenibacillus psychroresistens]QGQ95821.1 hypothetical protein EHS13_13515 [Paenibacillus psychroresistens]